ncbi:chemotaxis protein CheW [uncultured Clostridium sp.]|jgi:purine-binding chemotaxis protein CheW|uniref:chemotaxis protein CheW n=1 Tax=uncultured Clostridium sp. TaxID=59620 RepID=UPI0026393239|nr:chemotaxis protein CheW [uncultured Clostridium sp.]
MQIVMFSLGDEEFAVETLKVQNISNNMLVTKVPKSDRHIRGLINLRGSIISLVDINLLLRTNNEFNEKGNIIIINIDDEEIAISVDKVREVLDIDEKMIQKLDAEEARDYVKGIINLNGNIITLIDLNILLGN